MAVLNIEKKIAEMVHTSRDWESCDQRIYKRQDVDGDGIRDVILLTTFEHENYWRQELFVCLSSAPQKVMHRDLGGRNERKADELDVHELKIIVKGRRIVDGDAMCCPSQPYESVFVVVDGKIVQKQ